MFEWIAGLIPSLPLAAALWIGIAILFGWASGEAHERRTSRIALAASAGSFAATLALVAARFTGELPELLTLGRWLTSGAYQVNVNFVADSLGLTLTILATLLCLLVTRFSVNYLHREAGFHRFFMILSLFTAAMLVLFMSGNAVLTFVGWEVAGLCSYLLIVFFQDWPVAAENATRVFVTNRIGDAGFLLGIALAFHWLGGVDWTTMATGAAGLSAGQVGALAGCFLLAAVAKSGQIPLAPWLARAMEGPTPSSALFYGAVMVHAGVYLLLRLQPVFEQSPAAMAALAIIGLATALYGFWAGLAQTDIKSALIFSTTGQLGLMDVLYTPGHTDDSYSFVMPDRVFSGDTLLIRGGRTDFQNGDPRAQYESIFGRLLKLPDSMLIYPAHDYKGDTVSTIGEERAFNPRLQVKSIDEYVDLMNSLHLPNPRMMDVAIPANRHIGLHQDEIARRGWALMPDEALGLVGQPSIELVDLREPHERDVQGVIPGSVHLPYADLDENIRNGGLLNELASATGKRIVFYCAFGERSAMAVEAAQAAGLSEARHIQGGVDAWKKAKGPLVR